MPGSAARATRRTLARSTAQRVVFSDDGERYAPPRKQRGELLEHDEPAPLPARPILAQHRIDDRISRFGGAREQRR